MRISRRGFVVGLAGLGAAACTRPAEPLGLHGSPAKRAAVELHAFFDLPAGDHRSNELSGIAWDADRGVLWGIQDASAVVVALVPDRDLRSWSFGPAIPVSCDGPLDLEGIIVTNDGFLLASEAGPRVIEVGKDGKFLREVALPDRFKDARHNKSLESLTASPSGRYVFTTTEVALPTDGDVATLEAGTRVRIVRIDRQTREIKEYAYATDPSPFADGTGDWGVSDLAALSDNELLVLERGFAALRGNVARIHHVTIEERTTCGTVDALNAATPALTKRLFVDLARLVAHGLPEPKQPQTTPLMDNYEGLAIGPKLSDGRHSLIVVSDDNAQASQVARILVLAYG